MKISREVFFRLRTNLQLIAFDGIGLTIILVMVCSLLAVNIFKDIQSGYDNAEIGKAEVASLKEVQSKNEELKTTLDEVSSLENMKLVARDVLGLAAPGERVYVVDDEPEFYEVKLELLDLSEKHDYSDWWTGILR